MIQDNRTKQVSEMRDAETVLGIIRDRGSRGLPLEDLYRRLFNPELYLLAYGKIYRNEGATTAGVTDETVDGMSLDKIQTIIETLQYERYVWSPARRVSIPKKNSDKKRPLGIPTWSDKLLQEVIRLLLEAYYEPQFSDHSHGFRPQRGCHTALVEIKHRWRGTKWFIEGDIQGCFDTIDHTILLSILGEKLHDNRFIRLIENLIKAGYLEEWRYNATRSGTPQGGVISPLLANIYLDRLDQFIDETLQPASTRGTRREPHPEYSALMGKARQLRNQGETERARELRAQAQTLPSVNPNDPEYRRLNYVRYADDFLLGFIGPHCEAEEIKKKLGTFLRAELKLELSEAKTRVTHAQSETARFLGYEIEVYHENRKLNDQHRRTLNGGIGLKVPYEAMEEKCQNQMRGDKPVHRVELLNDTDFTIIRRFQDEYRGFVEYYRLAYNLHKLGKLRWIMEQSLVKTLAYKLGISVATVHDRFQTTAPTEQGPRTVLEVTVPRSKGGKPLIARWGGISLKWKKNAILDDREPPPRFQRTELEKRLLAEECELCGSHDRIAVHHIRALRDLRKRDGSEPPRWKQTMAERRRKSLVVCRQCHNDIHAGRYDGAKVRQRIIGEPGALKGARPVRRGAVGKGPA